MTVEGLRCMDVVCNIYVAKTILQHSDLFLSAFLTSAYAFCRWTRKANCKCYKLFISFK